MRDYNAELEKRVAFIQNLLKDSNAKGIVYGNSGGKDSALVGILCKKACDNVLGVLMPCQSKRNFNEDIKDGLEVANQFGIETVKVDLSDTKETICKALGDLVESTGLAKANINPRLRMTTLYAIAHSRRSLVAGTGNCSEAYVGYFTKWGDGAYDFNPIADLTVTEIYDFLRFLNAPKSIIEKAPSAALFEGQTDEKEMGFKYAELDEYLLTGKCDPEVLIKIERMHKASEHKRRDPAHL